LSIGKIKAYETSYYNIETAMWLSWFARHTKHANGLAWAHYRITLRPYIK